MKRVAIRLSALAVVVALGLFAIVQFQRGQEPAETAAAAVPPESSAASRGAPTPIPLVENPPGGSPATSRSLFPADDQFGNSSALKRGNDENAVPTPARPGARGSDVVLAGGDRANDDDRYANPAADPRDARGPNASGRSPYTQLPPSESPVVKDPFNPGDGRYPGANDQPNRDDLAPPLESSAPLRRPGQQPASNMPPATAPSADHAVAPYKSFGNAPMDTAGGANNSDPIAPNPIAPNSIGRPAAGRYAAPPDADALGGIEGTGRPGEKQIEGAQSPVVTVEKIAPREVQVGKAATFEVKIRNTGSVPAQALEIHDQVPKGAQLVSTNPAATRGPRGEVIWTLGTLKPGDEIGVQMQLMPVAEGEIGSVATVHFGAEASARSICTKPELILQVNTPPKVMIGGNVTLAIKLSNPGSGKASGVVLAEAVPAGLKHASGSELEFDVGDLAPGETRNLDLALTAAQAGRVVNVMTARGEGSLKAEARSELEVVAPALEVSLTGPKRRFLERQASYTVSVSNPGTAPAKDVELVTHLPKGMKFVKADNSGQYDAKTHSVYWSLDELPPTESGNVTLVAIPMEEGEQKLRIEGKAQQGLATEQEQSIVVEGAPAVVFDVVDTADPIEVGGETTYEIRVVNQGSKAATNVNLAALAPAECKIISAEGPTRFTVEGQRVMFDPLARLAPKVDTTYRIRVQAVRAGDLRMKVQLVTGETRNPVTKEESTRVDADQ